MDELDGVAEGADVDPLDLFAASIEEIWGVSRPRRTGCGGSGRCSDLVATAPLTADGHVVVGPHQRPVAEGRGRPRSRCRWDVDGEPPMFTIGIGPWISVGWNAAGLSLTGNELTPNDNKVGVPRLLQVRDMLRMRTMDEAVAAALRPDRASSYSNVLAHRDGSVVCVEGSASDAELLRADDGTLAHTNHYVSDRMLGYEGDPEYAESSAVRYRRARALLDEMRASGTPVTMESMRAAISDHEGDPSICRHETEGSDVKTVFWCVADVTAGRVDVRARQPLRLGASRRRRCSRGTSRCFPVRAAGCSRDMSPGIPSGTPPCMPGGRLRRRSSSNCARAAICCA